MTTDRERLAQARALLNEQLELFEYLYYFSRAGTPAANGYKVVHGACWPQEKAIRAWLAHDEKRNDD